MGGAPSVRFRAEIVTGGGQATGIPVPEEVLEGLGAGRRVPVVVAIGGHSYRSTVTPYQGRIMVPLSAENRTAAGVAAGDEVEVTLTRDDAPREVEVPDDLASAIAADEAASGFFASLPPSHKKAYVTWITEAKKAETRASRVESAVGMLREGKRR
ncbi:YdeI/OmpD-associated family protein [Naasia sp. SYSU D00057]|uniref:YdeI/OmpD-associated family protein n=1 Tax=Naasia sp. SYSU D00057 TaxID=2817380 RepID=UPI001B30EAFC|nr:YdeI/OmpD-associated family protein [Naasia sp. SYSU D00057]